MLKLLWHVDWEWGVFSIARNESVFLLLLVFSPLSLIAFRNTHQKLRFFKPSANRVRTVFLDAPAGYRRSLCCSACFLYEYVKIRQPILWPNCFKMQCLFLRMILETWKAVIEDQTSPLNQPCWAAEDNLRSIRMRWMVWTEGVTSGQRDYSQGMPVFAKSCAVIGAEEAPAE